MLKFPMEENKAIMKRTATAEIQLICCFVWQWPTPANGLKKKKKNLPSGTSQLDQSNNVTENYPYKHICIMFTTQMHAPLCSF